MTRSTSPRTVAVVVAFNRRDLLVEVLAALAEQSEPLAAVVVVDNASTDDSSSVALAAGPLIDLVRLERNTGGAGGFAAGIAHALAVHEPDWLWLMDDDTVPTPSALEHLRAAADRAGCTVGGSRVVWTDGSEHPMNTPRRKPFTGARERRAAAAAGAVPIRSTSFVSMLARADAVRRAGLPIADYFIWNDDFEYSTRLLREGRGLHVPASVVIHKTRVLGSTDADPGERFYYEVRNKIWMFRQSHGLRFWEKLLYGASTIRRWWRTDRRSTARDTIRDAFRRGWRDGWALEPRPTSTVLEGLPVTDAVVRVERGAREASR